ncbi:hypothetical protein FGO68_gene988 [Halteria grandinella]|uniref:Uncharacterized protein n=1 Tax=Halteria grandinella TaxID=5974 RepID=A0A8J8NG07_HALGN|nr:hypothetical protein FGO68_gene988 [Halteria grandinella]
MAYNAFSDALVVTGSSDDQSMRDDYVPPGTSNLFGIILYFSGPQKDLIWAKGIDIGDFIDEVTMSADGLMIVMLTLSNTYLILNKYGVYQNALKHPNTDPFLSRDVKTLLISSVNGQRIYTHQRFIVSPTQQNVVVFHFPYNLNAAQSYLMESTNIINTPFVEIYPLAMVFNSDEQRVWTVQLLNNERLLFNSFSTATGASQGNNKNSDLENPVAMSTITFSLQHQAFGGNLGILVFALFDVTAGGVVNLLVGIEAPLDPTIVTWASYKATGVSGMKVFALQIASQDIIYAAVNDGIGTYLMRFKLTPSFLDITLTSVLPSNVAEGPNGVFKTVGAANPPTFLMLISGQYYKFVDANLPSAYTYQGVQVYSSDQSETYQELLSTQATISLGNGLLTVQDSVEEFWGDTCLQMVPQVITLTGLRGIQSENLNMALFPLYTPSGAVPEQTFNACLLESISMAPYLIDSFCPSYYEMSLANGQPLPAPTVSYSNTTNYMSILPGPLANYSVYLKKFYYPIVVPSNTYDYREIKLVAIDTGCIKFVAGSVLTNADVYLNVPFIYNLPPIDGGFAGGVVAITNAPVWAVASNGGVGGTPIFTFTPVTLGDLGDNQQVSFYLDDGSIRSVEFSFFVNVKNRAPVFDNGAPFDIIVNLIPMVKRQ